MKKKKLDLIFYLKVGTLAAFLSTPLVAEEAGVKAFRILKTFQAVFAACPAVANTCSVASPALSPNLSPNLIYQIQLQTKKKAYA